MQKKHQKKRKHTIDAGGCCVCIACGERIMHQKGTPRFGIPCLEARCPQCGAKMVKKGSKHHGVVEDQKNAILL